MLCLIPNEARSSPLDASSSPALTPPQATGQEALDRQDGIVLAILRQIWSPLRDARDEGAAVVLPPLGALERLLSSAGSKDDEEPGAETPAPGSPAQS